MKELTMNQMEEVYGGVIPPLMVAAVKLVADQLELASWRVLILINNMFQ